MRKTLSRVDTTIYFQNKQLRVIPRQQSEFVTILKVRIIDRRNSMTRVYFLYSIMMYTHIGTLSTKGNLQELYNEAISPSCQPPSSLIGLTRNFRKEKHHVLLVQLFQSCASISQRKKKLTSHFHREKKTDVLCEHQKKTLYKSTKKK